MGGAAITFSTNTPQSGAKACIPLDISPLILSCKVAIAEVSVRPRGRGIFREPLCCRCVGSIARDPSGQTVTGAGEEDSRPPRACKVSDLASLGPRTDCRGEAHRGGEVGRLPDATPDVDCRGDPPRSEARLTSSRPHRGSGLVTLASNYTPCRRVGSAHKSPIARAFPGPNLRLW